MFVLYLRLSEVMEKSIELDKVEDVLLAARTTIAIKQLVPRWLFCFQRDQQLRQERYPALRARLGACPHTSAERVGERGKRDEELRARILAYRRGDAQGARYLFEGLRPLLSEAFRLTAQRLAPAAPERAWEIILISCLRLLARESEWACQGPLSEELKARLLLEIGAQLSRREARWSSGRRRSFARGRGAPGDLDTLSTAPERLLRAS